MKNRYSQHKAFRQRARIAIIGCRNVRASSVYSLIMNDAIDEVILTGRDGARLAGEVEHLRTDVPLAHQATVRRGTLDEAARAAIVIVAAGIADAPGKSAGELLKANARLVRLLARKLKRRRFAGILLVITNPVDILTRIAQEESGLPPSRVIGSGIALETPRSPAVPGGKLSGAQIGKLISQINGEPESAAWCAARIGGSPLPEFCTPDCPEFEQMLVAVRRAAPFDSAQSYSPLAARTCVNRICEAILEDERTILPVSVKSGGQYGISGVYSTLPAVVGRGGVENIVELPLGEHERKDLLASAAALETIYESLKRDEKLTVAEAARVNRAGEIK